MFKKAFVSMAVVMLSSSAAFAGGKAYQVTGPVTELTDTAITVQKGKEKWEIARGNAEVPADVKVGSKVTVQYTMTAESIASKAADKKAK